MRRSLWRDGDFLLLWSGQTVSLFGSQVSWLALPTVAVVLLGASTFQVAALAAVSALPSLLVSLPAGVLADRYRKRPVMIGCDLGCAAAMGSIPLAWWWGHVTLPQLYAVSLVVGVLGVLFASASASLPPLLVGPDRLIDANGKLNTARGLAEMAGPSAGGFLIGLTGAANAITLDSLSYLISATTLTSMHLPEPNPPHPPEPNPVRPGEPRIARPREPDTAQPSAPRATRPGGPSPGRAGETEAVRALATDAGVACRAGSVSRAGRFRADLAAGLRLVLGHPVLRAIGLAGAASAFLLRGVSSLWLVYVVRDLHWSVRAAGLVYGLSLAGGVVGSILASRVVSRLGMGRSLILGALLSAPFELVTPAVSPGLAGPWIVAVVFTSLTAIGMIYATAAATAQQLISPPGMLGRMSGSNRFLQQGLLPLGPLAAGGLATWIGLRPTLFLFAGATLLCPLILTASPLRTMREAPTHQAYDPVSA